MAPQYDADEYAEILIAATWAKQGAQAAARIGDRLDAPFLADDERGGATGAAEVARRLEALADYCRDEVLPLVSRLERGLDGIIAASGDPTNAAWRARAIAHWPVVRAELERAFPTIWLKARRARDLYARLGPAGRALVDRRHGPLVDPDGRSGPPLRAHWPGERIARLDGRARALGLLPAAPSGGQEAGRAAA